MKSIFVIHNGDAILPNIYGSRAGAELVCGSDDRVVEYVPLTRRVRLGLWLAEKPGRTWSPHENPGGWRVFLSEYVLTKSEGTGPTLDAAIEDAMGKLGGAK